MSTKTTNYEFIKPELTDSADITNTNSNWDNLDNILYNISNKVVPAISTDGINYTVSIGGVTELYVGLRLTIVPNMVSATISPKLNVNNLGDKNLIMPIDGVNTSITTNAAKLSTWVVANMPMEIVYDGERWRSEIKAQSAQYLYGKVPIQGGGTYADDDTTNEDKATARSNLGAQAQITSGTAAPSGGSNGDVYIQIIS